MFSKDMIAPCGLDCAVCIAALREDNPCPGCRAPGVEGKSEHCAKLCKILFCSERQKLSDGYCDGCANYPCAEILRMEDKYQKDYPLKESLIDNLSRLRSLGIDDFLKEENAKWRCKHCGGIICVHTGKCPNSCI